jgi:hypothetical protein
LVGSLWVVTDGRSAISVAEERRELVFYDPHAWRVQDTLSTPDCAGIDHADFTPDGRTAVFLREHVPNAEGLGRACRTGGTGVPYVTAPCSLRTLAKRAREIAAQRAAR